MAVTLKASEQGLAIIEQAIRRKGWTKTHTSSFWDAAYTSQATLRRFWRGIAIQKDTFIAICKAVGIENWQAIAQLESEAELDLSSDFFSQFKTISPNLNERRLAAILCIFAADFLPRMTLQEEQTLGLIRRDWQMMAECCSRHEGRVFKYTGDRLLVYFNSAIDALNGALEIQKILVETSTKLSSQDILEHRIGIHLGDIFINELDIMGNGVNIAINLPIEVASGAICLSQTVYEVVKNALDCHFQFLGCKKIANISEKIPIYQILTKFQSLIPEKDAVATPINNYISTAKIVPTVPEGPVSLDSLFYLERPPLETSCDAEIQQPGALIRIKAPRQMGKTSLLNRILANTAEKEYQTVRLNLLQAESTVFSSLERFLRWFCAYVSQKTGLPSQLKDYWDEDFGSILNCTLYFERYLLESIEIPLILALDEVDRVFQFPDIAQSFLPMLRSWHEEAKITEIWEKLRLIVVHSTEDYGTLEINQSPFNVGLPVELPEFTPQQVQELAQRHQIYWDQAQLQALLNLIGGHPYLVRLALYHIARNYINLEQILTTAPTASGIYEEHLRRLWSRIKEHSQLTKTWFEVVNSSEPIAIETIQSYQLYSIGLIQRQGDRVTPRCQLYRLYFQK
jgi:class 3 adenylate cyclase